MPTIWPKNVRRVRAGEAVSAGVVGRPDSDLESRTQYLRQRLDDSSANRAIFDYDASLAPGLLVGQAVYWDDANQRWDQALAEVENDAASGTLVPTKASQVQGMLYSKKTSTLGDVVLMGLVQFPSLENAITGPVLAGRYYLSSADPGKLVAQKPPVSIAVCYVLGAKDNCDVKPWVIVSPDFSDFINDHIHYRFELTCLPAGTTSAADALANGFHEITDADPSRPGWLPALDSSFNGTAPTGAKFGYNIAADAALSKVWPPIPLGAVALIWDKGTIHTGGTEVPLGPNGLVICDSHGIWWMSDCFGDVPWPADFNNAPTSSSSLPAEPISVLTTLCPRVETMRLAVAFVRMVFATDKTVVTSLRPAAGSPIRVTNADNVDATTGDLYLSLLIDALLIDTNAAGATVLKSINDNFQFAAGPVTEGLVADSDQVVLNGTIQRSLVEGDDTSPTVHQGIVHVDINLSPQDREDSAQIVRLSDVAERFHKEIPCLGFTAGRTSSLVARFDLPPSGLPNSPRMFLRAILFGQAAGTLPLMTMQYKRLPRPVTPGGASDPQALPTSWTAITFNSAVAVTADAAIEITSDSFEVEAGDTVLVKLQRDSAAGYANEVDLVRLGRVITS